MAKDLLWIPLFPSKKQNQIYGRGSNMRLKKKLISQANRGRGF